MSFPCLDCPERFQDFKGAQKHNEETDHEIGAWRADRDV